MSEKLLRVVLLAVACLSLFATRAHGQQGRDIAVWQGGNGNFTNASQWLCDGPDFVMPSPCVPNGSQFVLNQSSGTVNIDTNVTVFSLGAGPSSSLSLSGTSLTLGESSLAVTLASLQLTNGSAINNSTGAFNVLNNLTMQNSTVNSELSVGGSGNVSGTANISGSVVQALGVDGSFTISNSTLGNNSALVNSGQSIVSGTSFNGQLALVQSGSVVIDNGSKINSVIFGTPVDVDVALAPSSSATLTIQGGSQLNVNGANLVLGGPQNTSGTVFLSATSSINANNELVGIIGTGAFNQAAGTNTVVGALILGDQAGGNGDYEMKGTGTLLTAGNEMIGNSGTGFFGQAFGTQTLNQITGTLTLGGATGGNGTYVLSGTASGPVSDTVTAANEIVGDSGTGVFSQGGSSDNNISGTLTVGKSVGGSGTYDLPQGATVEASTEVIGGAGTGTFKHNGGTNTVSGQISIGDEAGSTGTYTQTSGDVSAATMLVGNAGTGTFTQTAGTNTISGTLSLGDQAGGGGTYNLGGGSLSAANLLVGNNGTGTFSQTGGTNTISSSLTIAGNPVGGTYELQAGGALTATTIQVNLQGTLKLDGGNISYTNMNLAGGTVSGNVPVVNNTLVTGFGTIDAATFINNGTVNFQGGVTTINGDTTNAAQMTMSSQTIFNGNLLNLGTFTNLSIASFGGQVTNNGIFNNFGSANGIPSGVTFIGAFTDNAAYVSDPSTNHFQQLVVNSSGYLTSTAGDLFSVAGNFHNLSTQNTLWNTSGAELDFTGGGTHTFDLAGRNGAGFSNNFAWGSLLIDPGNTLDLAFGSGDALYAFILQGLMISGNTITNIDGTPGLFLYYDAADNPFLNGNYNLTGGGELIAANGPAATPEPTTLLLFVSGLGSLLARRSWSKKRRSLELR